MCVKILCYKIYIYCSFKCYFQTFMFIYILISQFSLVIELFILCTLFSIEKMFLLIWKCKLTSSCFVHFKNKNIYLKLQPSYRLMHMKFFCASMNLPQLEFKKFGSISFYYNCYKFDWKWFSFRFERMQSRVNSPQRSVNNIGFSFRKICFQQTNGTILHKRNIRRLYMLNSLKMYPFNACIISIFLRNAVVLSKVEC